MDPRWVLSFSVPPSQGGQQHSPHPALSHIRAPLSFYKDRQTFPQALSLIPSLDVPWLEVRERCTSGL